MMLFKITLFTCLAVMQALAITEGYAGKQSVLPGQTITFHVSTLADSFYFDVYRRGAIMEKITTLKAANGGWFKGANYYQSGQSYVTNGCNWPAAYTLTVPQNWKSGLYVVRIVANKDTGVIRMNYATRYYQDRLLVNQIIFVVKSATPGVQTKILMALAFDTYQAYNGWDGGSYYYANGLQTTVSFLRPFGDYDGYNQGPTDWDYKFIQWAEGEGVVIDYCVDLDLEVDATLTSSLVRKYQLLVVNGHSEYWSQNMIDCVTNFQTLASGNVFISSGNTAWWYVTFGGNNTQMIKGGNNYANDFIGGSWKGNIYHPERYGHYPVDLGFGGLTVSTAGETSWVFANTGLKAGNKFGAQSWLVGYESDGLTFTRTGNVFTPTESAPAGTQILAANTYTGGKDPGCQDADFGFSTTFCVFKRGAGTFINEGNIDWAYGLVGDSGSTDPDRGCVPTWSFTADPAVQQITRNILVRLGKAVIIRTEHAPAPETAQPFLSAWPNPFARGVRLSFNAAKQGERTQLSIYDLQGKTVRAMTAPEVARSLAWDGCGREGAPLAAGCYLVRLEQGKSRLSKLVFLKR
jgi:hypothetical protein